MRRFSHLLTLFCALVAVFSPLGDSGVGIFAQTDRPNLQTADTLPYLSEKYFAAQKIFDQGDYIGALQEYGDEIRRTGQSGRRNWVDSICYHARVGECHYQMGENANAMACFEIALQDYLSNCDCFKWLRFDTADGLQFRRKTTSPWGDAAKSQGEMAVIPDRVNIEYMLGDASSGFRVAPDAELRPIDPTEMAVCLAMALSRRAELLGPLGRYDELNEKLVQKLRERPFPKEHWSLAWGDILLAMALVTAGNDTEAKTLFESGMSFANEVEHPLSGFALLELGKIASRFGDYPAACLRFEEASYSAWRYEDAFVLCESFRNLVHSRKMTVLNTKTDPLSKALQWAETERLRNLQIWLKTLMAEEAVFRNDLRSAETIVKQTRDLAKQHDIEYGRLVGHWDYIAATNAYGSNNIVNGDKTLEAALERVRRGSAWCCQLTRLKELFDSGKISINGEISPRVAAELYARLLREPTDFDWQSNTLETLAVHLLPREDAYEQWFALTVAQRDYQKAFEVAERTRRHRFLSTQPLGNRLISLRYLLEAPNHLLTREQLMQRAKLLSERAELKQASEDMLRVCRQIAAQPLVASDNTVQKRLDASYRELESLVEQHEAMLHRMALESIATPDFFPPLVTFDEFRRQLPDGTLTLMYFETMGEIYGFQVSRSKCEIWRINDPQQLKTNVSKYLSLLGQNGAESRLEIDDLTKSTWAKVGQTLFLELLGGERTLDFTELVIVPDSFLWYLPFETLSVDVGDKRRPLVALPGRTVRYAPTATLGLPIVKTNSSDRETLVMLGKMSASQDASVVRNAFARMNRQANKLVSMTPSQLTYSPALYGKFLSQLLVLSDIAPSEYDFDWAPLLGTRELPGSQFSYWQRLPWGGPKLMILPGYHTAAEDALKNGGDGRELFMPLMAMLSCGTETVIISRWQSGGRTVYDQIGEYLKNIQDGQYTAAQAWQRASLQTAAAKLIANEEPRISGTITQRTNLDARANHPFFWGGCLFCDRGHYIPQSEPPVADLVVPEMVSEPETTDTQEQPPE